MVTTYNFQTELEALQLLFGREGSLDVKYVPVTHASLIPLLSMFGQALKGMKSKEARSMRLSILSLWLGKRVKTSYELTTYQCSTVLNFLEFSEGSVLTERAKHFLDDSKAAVESRDFLGEIGELQIEPSSPFMPKLP